MIKRFRSPVIYYADETFRPAFMQLIGEYYSPTAVFYHHHSLAVKFWEELKEENEVKLKSWFYLIRSLLSCIWIVKDKTVLPMHIGGLMTYVDKQDRQMLEDLILLKATVGETYLHPQTEAMRRFVAGLFDFIEPSKNNLGVNNKDYSLLNDFFLKLLHESAND